MTEDQKLGEADLVVVVTAPTAEELLVRTAQKLAADPRTQLLAGLVGVAAIGGAPKGTTLQ
jgi:hypothetical protein